MKLDKKAIVLALTLAWHAAPSWAQHAFLEDRIVISGFSTLGGVRTNSDEGELRRDDQISGADSDGALDVDSNLGLQITASATDWLSATVQSLTMQRDQGKITTEIEWAYLKIQPIDSLSLLAGRMALPLFLVSDSRNVGYANPWLRPPNEVYGLAMLHRLEGANLTYALSIGETTLTASAIAGRSSLHLAGDAIDIDHVKGGSLQWEVDALTLRASRVQGHVPGANDTYEFSGVGATYDRGPLLLQGEFVTRRSKNGFSESVDSNGWYTLAGFRTGKLVPYGSYASTKPTKASPFHLSERQSKIAAGLRWEAFSSAAVKFQIERIDTYGTAGISFVTPLSPSSAPLPPPPPGVAGPPPGQALLTPAPLTKPVTAVSLSIDWVF